MAKLRSINPATGKELRTVRIATKVEVEETVRQAKAGFEKWRDVSLSKRYQVMFKVARLLRKEAERLGEMITKEMGKPLVEAVDEVMAAADGVEYVAKEAKQILRDEVVEPKLPQTKLEQMKRLGVEDALGYLNRKGRKVVSVVRYDPVGVVAAIKPWNYPVDTVMLALAPALVAGNSVVFKPSEYVSLVSNQLVKLLWQAGVPRDGLQVLYGRGQVGAMLVDAEVDMVTFTGSTEVGKEIAEKCSKRLIKHVLELGGSSPALILRDADLDLAVNGVLWGRFANCGQVCNAIKRVFVEEIVAEQFVEKLVKATDKLRVGNPLDKGVDIGPLVSLKQLRKLQDQVTRGVVQGGRILAGGRRLREEPYVNGFFHEPTVMVHVNSKQAIMQEEIFGPVLAVGVVDNLRQAIKQANENPYGLTAAVYTKSKKKAERAMKELKVGSVYVNDSSILFPETPWSGLKESGVGVEGGRHGIWEFTDKKHMHINYSQDKTRDWWFPY